MDKRTRQMGLHLESIMEPFDQSRKDEFVKLLLKHFPQEESALLQHSAEFLSGGAEHGYFGDLKIERRNVLSDELKIVLRIERNLQEVISAIGTLGPSGKATLVTTWNEAPLGEKMKVSFEYERYEPWFEELVEEAESYLATPLELAKAMREDLEAKLDGWKRRPGRPSKTEAAIIAEKCASCFSAFSDQEPAVTVDTRDHSAKGPFYDFVADVFKAHGISASVETFAKAAGKNQKEKNSKD